MAVKAFVFDMDGTILHTLPDLYAASNAALTQLGYPTRTYEEILAFMGNGAQRLIECALPEGSSPSACAQAFQTWRSIYLQSAYEHTEPFPGITQVFHALRERGAKVAILSNKYDAGVQVLTERFFPGLVDVARGERPPTPRKPDPTSLFEVLDELGVSPAQAVYIGDTNVDVKLARAAGLPIIGVSWGYDAANPLPVEQLDAYIHDPAELLALA